MEVNRTRNFLLLMLLAALWSPSFLFIKVAVAEIPPVTVALGRVIVGALILWIILRLQGRHLPPPGPVWRHLLVLGLVQNAGPFVLFAWGEQFISSALASIVNGMTPIFTIILAHFFLASDRLTRAKVVGVGLGFGGLLLIIAPSLTAGIEATTFGLLAIVLATLLYGIAGVYSARYTRGLPPLVAPAGQLLMATLWLLPLSLVTERPWALAAPSWEAWASLLALGALGTGIAFAVYYRLLQTAEPSFISMVTYVIPIFGVLLGILVLGEQLTWNAMTGFGLILAGVVVVNGRWRTRATRVRS